MTLHTRLFLFFLTCVVYTQTSFAVNNQAEENVVLNIENNYYQWLLTKNNIQKFYINEFIATEKDESEYFLKEHDDLKKLDKEEKKQYQNLLAVLQKSKKDTSAWIKQIIACVNNSIKMPKAHIKLANNFNENSLTFIEKYFFKEQLAPLRWQSLQALFGKKLVDQVLEKKFHAEHYKKNITSGAVLNLAGFSVLLVNKMLKTPNEEAFENEINSFFNKYKIVPEQYTISPYLDTESKAHELKTYLQESTSKKPVIIISSGEASSVVYKFFDIFPNYRKNTSIKGWINIDGFIYGTPLTTKQIKLISDVQNQKETRQPASTNPLMQQELRAVIQSASQQSELANKPLGLGPGFPIVNIVNEQMPYLIEAIITDGQTIIYAPHESPFTIIPYALKFFVLK